MACHEDKHKRTEPGQTNDGVNLSPGSHARHRGRVDVFLHRKRWNSLFHRWLVSNRLTRWINHDFFTHFRIFSRSVVKITVLVREGGGGGKSESLKKKEFPRKWKMLIIEGLLLVWIGFWHFSSIFDGVNATLLTWKNYL